jgi:hypothetical protein
VFTLENANIAENSLDNAPDFIACWNQFYEYHIRIHGGDIDVDYVAELGIGHELTEENCRRLLRWKDPKFLTHKIQSGPNQGQLNPRVERTTAVLPQINLFRRDRLSEDDFKICTGNVFPTGLVWQVFLFHIAKPHIYPIADQHVFRVFCLHRDVASPRNWDFYQQYREYFGQIAERCGIALLPANVHALKRIDNALVVFGKFVKAYYRQ